MAMIDKYVSSARSLSILVITIATAAMYLAFVEVKSLSVFRETRNLIAHWLLYDRLQDEAELWADRGSSQFTLTTSWQRQRGNREYYRNFGLVVFRQGPAGFDIEVMQPPQEETVAPIWPRIAQFRPWTATVASRGFLKKIFEPLSQEQMEFSKKMKADVRKKKESTSPEELSGIDPSYLDERTYDPIWFPLSYEKYKVELQIAELFSGSGKTYKPEESPLLAYREIEAMVFNAETKVPLLDLSLSRLSGFLALLMLQLVLIALTRESIIGIREHRSSLRDEPWVVLDGINHVGHAIGVGWSLLLLLSPLAVSVAFGLFVFSRHWVGDLGGWPYVANATLLLAFTVLADYLGWQSCTLLLSLRKVHQTQGGVG